MHKVFPMSYPESSAKHPNSAALLTAEHGSSGKEELMHFTTAHYTLYNPLRVLKIQRKQQLHPASLQIQQSCYERPIAQVSNELVQFPLTCHNTTSQHVQ